jgi:ADP-ribose pyrophosphatase YjhB (NUDIX family)
MGSVHIDKSYGIIPYRLTPNGCEFLLIRQTQGHWTFPKGHSEGNETAIQSALREFREETGLEEVHIIESPSFITQYEFPSATGMVEKTVVYFLGEVRSGQTLHTEANEVQDAAWLSYTEALSRLTFDSMKELFRSAVDSGSIRGIQKHVSDAQPSL